MLVGVDVGMDVGVRLGAEESAWVGACVAVGSRVSIGTVVGVDGSTGVLQANSAKQSTTAPGHLLSRFLPVSFIRFCRDARPDGSLPAFA